MTKSGNKNSRLVYSTDQGRVSSKDETELASTYTDGTLRITRETKGRKGKGVSLVNGLPPETLKDTGKLLKQRLGVGGAVKNGAVEVQTDDREKIKQILESQGYSVKIAGG